MPSATYSLTTTVGSWVQVPITAAPGQRVAEVYITTAGPGLTLDAVAVGDFAVFSNTTPPQQCGFYATDAVVDTDALGPGYSWVGADGTGWIERVDDGIPQLAVLASAVETLSITVKTAKS